MPETQPINVGVIIERRELDNKWQDHEWRVGELVVGMPAAVGQRLIDQQPGRTRYLAGVWPLSLHTAEVIAYTHNLTSPRPSLFVALRRAEGERLVTPFELRLVSANPYEAEGYMEGDDGLVESRPMPGDIQEWIEAFVAEHYSPEPFRKRQRVKAEPGAARFGQEPIMELRRRLGELPEDET
jgi:hypothetical protein